MHLATHQPFNVGQGYRWPGNNQPGSWTGPGSAAARHGGKGSGQAAHRQLDCTWQRSNQAMVVRATGSLAPCNHPAGSLMRLCNAAALQWWSELRQAAKQQPARHPVMLQASALQYAAQQLRSQAADSWVALGNAIGGQGQGQLAPQAAGVTQQRCYHKHGQGQAGCMQLECT